VARPVNVHLFQRHPHEGFRDFSVVTLVSHVARCCRHRPCDGPLHLPEVCTDMRLLGKSPAAGAEDKNEWSHTSSPATFLQGLSKNNFTCRHRVDWFLVMDILEQLAVMKKKYLVESGQLPIDTEYCGSIRVTCTS